MRLCGATVIGGRVDTSTSSWRIVYPTDNQIARLRAEFAMVSRAFDRMFYRAGKRRTLRDSIFDLSHDPLARHNMVSGQSACSSSARGISRSKRSSHSG